MAGLSMDGHNYYNYMYIHVYYILYVCVHIRITYVMSDRYILFLKRSPSGIAL